MKKVFGNWWVVTGLVVLLLVVIACVGLPLFVRSLSPWSIRLAISVMIVGGWGLLGYLRHRKVVRASDAIAAELAAPSAADQESQLVASRIQESLATLRNNAEGRRNYLYDRPWYLIIGPPGAGKTTALVNSGLRFPFADQSLKGVGGTRNLDFWFADEAVLVDTAGRYTTQDSDFAADSQGWKKFLGLLKKQRPLSPINGVIVAIGVDELVRADRAGIDRHASLIRRRLAEIRSNLEVSFPVYFLLTKADLIAGFTEFYGDLDVEGRRAVLGATLPSGEGVTQDEVVGAFDRVVGAQQLRQAKRLFEEVDVARRSLILGYPAQLAGLRNRFARLIDGAFIAGDQPGGTLRGFYLTSGMQAGAPLDRILAGVAEVYQSQDSNRTGSGRAYFLNRLLTEVMFREAGLVQADPSARRRQAARLRAGTLAIAAAASVMVGLLTVSYFRNRAFQSELGEASAQVAILTQKTGIDLVEVRETDPDLEQSLAVLQGLRNLPQGYAAQATGEPGLLRRFGLYQSSHAAAASEAYRSGLRRILLPRLMLRLEQYLAANDGDPMALYQPLKVYLMLGGLGPLNRGATMAWITHDWADEQFPGADRASTRKDLEQHLAVLLDDQGLSSEWPQRKAPLDGTAIASARNSLQTLSLGDRAYAVLRQKALSGNGQPWRANVPLSAGDAQAFANGSEVLQLEVPYLYTREGYEKAYLLGLTTVASDLKSDIWVLGEDAKTMGIQAQIEQIKPAVTTLYARDYIDAWERVATMPRPAAYFQDAAARGAFTKTPSPLKTLLLDLRRNTTFQGGSGAAKGMLANKVASSRLGRIASAASAIAGNSSVDAATLIALHFKPLHDYIGDGKAPAPIDEFVAAVRQAGSAMSSSKIIGGGIGAESVQGNMATAMGSVETAAGGAPPQLQGFLTAAASGGQSASNDAAQGALEDMYARTILPDCQLATQDKYPFLGTAEVDAPIVDVQRVFGLSGSFDTFLQQRIVPLLDLSGPIWRWDASKPQAAALNPSSPDEFVKARQIRDVLAGGLNLRIEAKSFGVGIDAADFVAGNTRQHFERADAGSGDRPLTWSSQGMLPEAAVVLYSGGEKVKEVKKEGAWALFRLMDEAQKQNAGPQVVLASFGAGAQTVVFKLSLPNDRNPFGRGGLWSFRCPVSL